MKQRYIIIIMNVFAIISEYNPFHNGHLFQIDMAKKLGATHIIAIMSANFTQRGEIAIADKFYRSKAAIKSGVDLVLELPTFYSLSSAETFAFGAIYILNKIKIVDKLFFGAETDNLALLSEILELIESDGFKIKLLKILKNGASFPKAREIALRSFLEEKHIDELKKPNNILAIEYLKWLKRLKSEIKPTLIKRLGVGHNSTDFADNLTSAFNLRNMIASGASLASLRQFMPFTSYEVYKEAFEKNLFPALEMWAERAIIYKLRSISLEMIKQTPNVSEGLENRIFNSIKHSISLEKIYNNIKTKRYTMSRVKRIIYNIFLGINKDFIPTPQYIRVLSSNKRGLELLAEAKNKSELKISQSLIKLSEINEIAKKQADLEIYATDVYSLFLKDILASNRDLTQKFTVI